MNILIFKGIFRYGVVNYFAEDLATELCQIGHNTMIFDLDKYGDDALRQYIDENKVDLVLSFNGISAGNNEYIKKGNIILGILLVDPPFLHIQRIMEQKDDNVFICMYDSRYLQMAEKYIDDHLLLAQLFHGGTPPDEIPTHKEYDVIMCGSIEITESIESAIELLPEGLFREIALTLYSRAMKNYNITLDEIFEEVLQEKGILPEIIREDPQIKVVMAWIYTTVDAQVRNRKRYAALEAILKKGIKVQLYGKCSVEELTQYPNLTYKESIDYRSLLNEVAKSKILLNSLKPFTNGSHERILSAMLCRTLVVSNNNHYCNDDYLDNESIVYYDADDLETLVQKVEYYLENDEERERIIDNAYNITREKHMWHNRAIEIENIYRIVKAMKGSIER